MKRHFSSQFFMGNRHKLYEQLQPDSLLVMTAWTGMQRSLDQAFRFEQEPGFWYLTGVDWPDWLLMVDVYERREWLVAPHIAEVHQIFDGSLSADEASSISGVQQVVGKREGNKILKDLVSKRKQVYTLLPQDLSFHDFHPNPAQQSLVRKLRGLKDAKVEDIRLTLSRMRAIKQPVELQAIQRAVDITISGIKRVLAELSGLHSEHEADAVLTAEIRRQGATHAFDPIIAAGANTTTLHHEVDATRIGQNGWLLLDVGARMHHYCADISRTIPLGGTTDRQMELYESLCRDQQTIMSLMQPGKETRAFMQEAEEVLHDSFVRLGLMDKSAGRDGVYGVMPHALSHGLGYDVHDPLGRPDKLLPGMVMTAEIGLYVPEQGFGLRLEDDIVVTKDGPVNMSRALSTSLRELGMQ